jgi:intraflagellar transport protein 172
MAKIAAIAWAPNNLKLAICTSDRIIHLFDEMGEKKDKFSTKPVEPKVNPSSLLEYILRLIAINILKVT